MLLGDKGRLDGEKEDGFWVVNELICEERQDKDSHGRILRGAQGALLVIQISQSNLANIYDLLARRLRTVASQICEGWTVGLLT